MKINVRCPRKDCGQTYSVESSQLGKKTACKRCGQPFELVAETLDNAPTDETHPTPTKSAEPAQPKGQKFGRFEIRAQVGSGAFGTVYRAYDPTLEREVALKVPRSGVVMSEQAKARFLREPKAAAQLQHAHIVPVFETGSAGKHLYIASAFIEGETLDDKIGQAGLDFRQAARIVRDLADALHNAHMKGIVHRDVKSSNVMIDPLGQAMLMDFGLARMDYVDEHLTQEGSLTGTPAYMSPEQAGQGADKAGPASDQYSLGVVLYELLCGERPFQGSLMEVMQAILSREPTPPRQINPSVPLDLETICLRAMSKEPERRYESCQAMASDLHRWLDDKPISARPMGPSERVARWCRRNPALAGVSLTAVVLVAVSGIALSAFFSSSSERDVAQTQKQQTESKLGQTESKLGQAESDLERLKRELAETRQELAVAKEALAEAATAEERAAAQARIEAAEKQLAALQEKLGEPEDDLAPPAEPRIVAPTVDERAPPEPQPSPSLNPRALVSQPASISGVDSWTIETVRMRGDIVDIKFSPDGKYFAVAGEQGTVQLWEAQMRQLRHVIVCPTETYSASCMAWSPDSTRLAVSSLGLLKIWQIEPSPKCIATTERGGQIVWSPDGKYIASGGDIYDVDAGKWDNLVDRSWIYRECEWHPDSRRLAIAANESVEIWDVQDRSLIRSLKGHGPRRVEVLRWSPDGKVLAVQVDGKLPDDKGIVLYSEDSGEVFAHFQGDWAFRRIGYTLRCWSRDSRRLLISGYALSVLWEPSSGRRIELPGGGAGSDEFQTEYVCFSPDGRSLVGHGVRQKSCIVVTDGDLKSTIIGGVPDCSPVSISPLGSAVASYHESLGIRVLRLDDLQKYATFPAAILGGLAWTRTGSILAYSGIEASIINVNTGQTRNFSWQCSGAPAWAPDGRRLLISSEPQSAVLADTVTGRVLYRLPTASGPVAWSLDGQRFVCGKAVYRSISGNKLFDLSIDEADSMISDSAYSPNGESIAVLSEKRLWFLESTTGRLESHYQIAGGVTGFGRLSWSPDGSKVYASLDTGQVYHVDRKRKEVKRIECDRPRSSSADFDPLGRFMLFTDSGAMYFVNLETGARFATVLLVDEKRNMTISPEGHYISTSDARSQIVYVVETQNGQETLWPHEMEEKYGWRNDPALAVIHWPEVAKEEVTEEAKP